MNTRRRRAWMRNEELRAKNNEACILRAAYNVSVKTARATRDSAVMIETLSQDHRPAPARFTATAAANAADTRAVVALGALCDNPPNGKRRESMTPPETRTDNAELARLVARIAERDQTAFAELYDASAGRLYAVALRIIGERASAEEIVSDAYYQIWTQAGRYDAQRGCVLAWMLPICRSRALDTLRQRDAAELHPEPQPLHPELDESGPLDILMFVERCDALHRALATLEARERLLLSLAFFKGLTHQEIAEHTALPLGSVKSILRRSMQALRPLLERDEVSAKEFS